MRGTIRDMLPFMKAPIFWQKEPQVNQDSVCSRKSPLKRTSVVMSDEVIIAVDVGTSGTKASAYQPKYDNLLRVSRRSHITYAEISMVTQRPSNWLSATLAACTDVLQDMGHITAISVTGQMQDLIGYGNVPDLLNDSAVLYHDARAATEATRLTTLKGSRILSTDLLSKLALLPSPLGQDYKFMIGGADYVCYELAGCPDRHFTHVTTAATTGLTKEPHRMYDTALFEQTELTPFLPLLPEIALRL